SSPPYFLRTPVLHSFPTRRSSDLFTFIRSWISNTPCFPSLRVSTAICKNALLQLYFFGDKVGEAIILSFCDTIFGVLCVEFSRFAMMFFRLSYVGQSSSQVALIMFNRPCLTQ